MQTLRPLSIAIALPVLYLGFTGVARSAAPLPTFEIDLPNEFVAGQPARASEVNENFDSMAVQVEERADEVDASLALIDTDINSLLARTDVLEQDIEDIARPANLIVVATEGGQFTSVVEALASINDASDENPYLVLVAPGIYEETVTAVVPAFVTLRGSGAACTIVRSAVVAASTGIASSSVFLESEAGIADLTVENTGASQISIAVGGAALSRSTRMQDIVARATGSGGVGHFAVHVSDSDVTLLDCSLFSTGASTVNTAFGCTDSAAAFAQPVLQGCDLEGDGTNSGFGVQMTSTAMHMDDCRVQGDFRAISTSVNGISTIRGCRIATLGLNPVYEQTGSASILSGNVFFVGGNPVGLASQFKYAHCIKPNFDVVVNGFGSSIQ